MNGWVLPKKAAIGGKEYPIHTDFRDILEIFGYLDDPELPEFIRWQVALALFYEGDLPAEHRQEAMEFLAEFLNGGRADAGKPAPRLLDWQCDCDLIISDVNRVAGREIRQEGYVHWWTFLSWFHAIGEGQLSTVVAIRDKLRRGKKLEGWERDFYREHKDRIDLKKPASKEELAEKQRLIAMLDGK
ncbi:MAG: hypothetical protein IJB11_07050 [Oscillospiraceae bacterium]|nr:hypothetical protein [Oscillospiraceae bacterium]MBQ6839403.1 hypothetical protein [Oscillospiraceae bacterium]